MLSNGTEVTLLPTSTSPFELTSWSLTIESWTAPSNLYDLNLIATRSNLPTIFNLQSLDPWHSMCDSLANVSGRGYYSTAFQWPLTNNFNNDGPSADGAFIDLGAIVHTARVLINSHAIPPMDITRARADISQYLVEEYNSVEVVVSTPLGHALRAIWDSLISSGKSAVTQDADPPGVADYGLVFPSR